MTPETHAAQHVIDFADKHAPQCPTCASRDGCTQCAETWAIYLDEATLILIDQGFRYPAIVDEIESIVNNRRN